MGQIELSSYRVERNGQRINLFLPDEGQLSELAYKVLHNMAGSRLLCCYRSRDNDQLKLTYDISRLVSLSTLIHELSPDALLDVVMGLLDALDQIYEIGFLEYRNTSLALDDIFLDSNNHQVHLLHVPVKSSGDLMSRNEFEQNFRACLRLILASGRAGDALEALKEALATALPLLPDLQDRLRSGDFAPPREETPEPPPPPPPQEGRKGGLLGAIQSVLTRETAPKEKPAAARWHLIGVNTDQPLDLTLTGSNFIVGKKPQAAQGVIPFDPSVSRVHCQFMMDGESCRVMDLGSSNGTYLNGKRLEPKRVYRILPGDRIRLSASDFVLRRDGERNA